MKIGTKVIGKMIVDEIAMVREGNHLVPVDEMSAEVLATIPLRTQVLVTAKVPRNLRQHRLAWALATKISEACDFLADREAAMDWLKIKARHVRYIHDHNNGETAIIPKSIRFAALDQMAFDRLFKRMVFVTVTQILPGIDEAALRAEIESMVGIDPAPPETAKPKPERKQRKPRAPIEKISVITNAESQPLDTSAPNPAERKEAQATSIDSSQIVSETVPESDPGAQVQFSLQPFYDKKFNIADWTEWTKAWLMAALIDTNVSDQDVMLRWNNERALRNECGVTTDTRQPMFDLYSKTIERIRNRRKS